MLKRCAMNLKKISKRFGIFIMSILILVAIIVSPTVYRGYKMYEKAVDEEPIRHRIEKIKASPSYVSIDEISPFFIDYLIESEDHRFYDHSGFSFVSIGRALVTNVKLGYRAEGGSSLTQQLAKNLYFSFEKTYERKVAELITALELERIYEKNDILEFYCNVVYFGEGCYGIRTASKHYYNKEPIQLTDDEATELVKTLKSPNKRNPNVDN